MGGCLGDGAVVTELEDRNFPSIQLSSVPLASSSHGEEDDDALVVGEHVLHLKSEAASGLLGDGLAQPEDLVRPLVGAGEPALVR